MSIQVRGGHHGTVEQPSVLEPTETGAFSDSESERLGLLSGLKVHVTATHTDQDHQTGSSWFASVFLVVNAALGAGLLNFPASFDKSGGVLSAIIIQAVLMVFIVSSLLVLAYCSDINRSTTYQDTVSSMCGSGARTAVSIIIILYTFGTCVTFFIIIGDQWDKFLYHAYSPDYCHHWFTNRTFTMITTSVVLVLPLCFPRRIDFLKIPSMLGVVGVLYCVILVTVKYFIGTLDPGPIKTHPSHWTDVFIVVPVICFGYQCHISVVPIYSCLKKRSLTEFTKTIILALAICAYCYTGTAAFGYLTFGSKVNEDILVSYSPTWDVLIAVILIAAKMYTTYPILLFVGRAAFESVWTDIKLCRLPPDGMIDHSPLRHNVMTVVWFVSTLLLAVIVPNIGVVISLLGGLAALFVFVFPGLCLLQVVLQGYVDPIEQKHKYRLYWVVAVAYLIIGGFLFGVVTTQAIYSDISLGASSSGDKNECQ